MPGDHCITAGNNPAMSCGVQANDFPFAGLHMRAVKSIFYPVCFAHRASLSDNDVFVYAFQFTKCSLFCKTLLHIISFNLVTMQREICPRSAGQTCLWRAGVTCHHHWTDNLNTDITSSPAFS